ncbi:indolepyruvate ferredoxin oxidoreductase family protein [Octadecabacter sp. 1_MG-2023]|uniref:indolepyruvate ferredoxin oxidoreductase family protein n=1 Tax=unclassified Octadecabacter TaxID=196158 RepID=UPI001C093B8D|nr:MULTISPECIES: indolepyruvate ferredoxin oxidoreductase family protein [unclassified Octadecabacter]MBU2993459.1 indolepyruvate ferredoxin oxidoreductase family protein [Octadecabacter sp. B2R22]MDO6733085.1 indolepyruvate ferredoxin oxidoreductase family protein [Octadecabacter sp. 1_MG-2023]
MAHREISLNDRFDLSKTQVLLNGTQALVRLMLMQKARDTQAGLNTAGYVTGYRGSPLGAVDQQMDRAQADLAASDILFQPGLNEDLAATALWGSQQAELRGEGTHDGVFGLWYGKGPGVDRSGDVMRHANMAGTSPHGGVVMAMGDDHTGESSTTLHQSDGAMIEAYMPIVSPAGVQEVMDYGLYAYALSRFSGNWVGLKTMKDTIEVTSVVNGDPHRLGFVQPEFEMPDGGVNIRLIDTPADQEARAIDYKRFAAQAFARANRIDKVIWPREGAKIGFVAAGKNWLDLVHAMSLLGVDEAEGKRMGISLYKVAQVWPLDVESFNEWAADLDLIVVVEEKRKLIETQIKEALFDDRRNRRVYGWHKGDAWENGRQIELFPTRYALDPIWIAEKIGPILTEEGCGSAAIEAGLAKLDAAKRADNAPEIASRLPYFCSGCPHNTSTKVPDGSRAYAGIGCHYMVQWMDRETVGFTQMGGEGANWVGEAPFTKRDHVFQNIGDGTYNHSGVQAIRFAVMAGTNMTYKILYNDAVAMTGGQHNDGDLTAAQICREVLAMGVQKVALVYDSSEELDLSTIPAKVKIYTRDHLDDAQNMLRKVKGVSVLVYAQTCAAEKRRRRKRGLFPDPDKRVFINTDVCEGCGDCGVQSNCVSIVPVETELGRKRAIDQSSCNKDFSCVTGFCPSFVTVQGGTPKKAATTQIDLPDMPDPVLPSINGTHNVVITGVGGTGVVTIGAVLAMAAHVDGKAAGMMEMAGLAQKGGAVHIHCRLANKAEDINAIRVATGECDALIGGDLVVSAGAKTLGLMATGRTRGVVNSHQSITGDFTRDTEFKLPADRLTLALQARLQEQLKMFDASELAKALMGDAIYSNMMVFGAAWQAGAIPVSGDAIRAAIELNGTAVSQNLQAFEYGRWAILHPDAAASAFAPNDVAAPNSLDEKIAFRIAHLTDYQDESYAARYSDFVGSFDGDLREAVALGYHKLLSYKDEYEVARLLLDTRAKAEAEFDGDLKLTHLLAPPLLSRKGSNGRPRKIAMPQLAVKLFPFLARLKRLRGTRLDVFGHTAERRMERALIEDYERDMVGVRGALRPDTRDAAIALAKLPLDIRGFGPVKMEYAAKAAKRREELLEILHGPETKVAAE